MLKRLFLAIIALHGFLIHGQCDVAITAVNLETYEVTVEVINSTGCIAAPIGGTPGKVSQLQIGYHLPEPINPDNEIIEDFNETFGLPSCSPNWTGYLGQNPDNNHPGWWYSPSVSTTFTSEIMADGLVTGDIVTIPLNPPGDYDTYPYPLAECGDDLIDYWLSEGECIEFVVWQLNYGNTWYIGNGGWASLSNNPEFAPGTYQDQNCNNSWYTCRDENPNHPVASPDLNCAVGPDAVVGNVNFEVGCIGDVPAYSLTYTIYNYGNEEITDYCIEIWNEDYYQCFDSELFGSYGIPPGEGQLFTTQFFEFTGNPGGFLVISVDDVNDEIITGNNNTTVYYPEEWPNCPYECNPDTVEVVTYILQIDSIFTTLYETDTLYIELPQDTIIEYVDNYIYDTTYIEIPIYLTDTLYIETTDTLYVETPIYITDTIVEYISEIEYVVDTILITTIDTITKYEYVYLTDTLYEYIYIDCETGLECIEEPGLDCPDWASIYIPNTFTPNNDGINDVFMMMYDLNCWVDVEFKIFNRWGDIIYEGEGDSFDSYPFWDGSIWGGSAYASDGVYIYTFYAKKVGSVEVYRKSGHLSLLR
jgi:gliding motility-associated-like protein